MFAELFNAIVNKVAIQLKKRPLLLQEAFFVVKIVLHSHAVAKVVNAEEVFRVFTVRALLLREQGAQRQDVAKFVPPLLLIFQLPLPYNIARRLFGGAL